jgi:predicted short-subunit dehydrogenase-like oxidoreductase (DUF2520 family)
MIKVSIIGSGNVAQHLITAFQKVALIENTIEIVQVFSRQKEALVQIIHENQIITNLQDLKEADLYIIAVSDDAIATVSAQLPFKNRLVVHTSGSIGLEVLSDNNLKGVFYPLQTFTKGKKVDFSSIPVCLEATNSKDFETISKLAYLLTEKVFSINSEQRKALHVAAVFVNNFTNHLYSIANQICKEKDIPFDILKPLILETAEKIITLPPDDAQTGPAKRNDQQTIQAHQAYITDVEQLKIYQIITQSILQHGKKL